jgi:hypothetical protein
MSSLDRNLNFKTPRILKIQTAPLSANIHDCMFYKALESIGERWEILWQLRISRRFRTFF